ncbi:MAG: alpha-2-macroglobulin [Planctomyces sp.]|nr:alpha-2-macroglobulin [Planctomyces sp.]
MLRPLSLLVGLLLCAGAWSLMAQELAIPDQRTAAEKAQQDGNFRDAYEIFRALCLNPENTGKDCVRDYESALSCLQRLQRVHDIDAFRESVVEAKSGDWRILQAIGRSYRMIENGGFIIGGDFHRGHHDQGGRYVTALERDRVRGLQLYVHAMALIGDEQPFEDAGHFFKDFADAVLHARQWGEAWRLQSLTDLSTLPDYDEAQMWGWRGRGRGMGGASQGAPVDAEGNPILYGEPESFAAAANDGERWRWLLEETVRRWPSYRIGVDWEFGSFLDSQFGVATLQQWGVVLPRAEEDENPQRDPRADIWALHTLDDSETIARLATGTRRFALPEEFNPIAIFKRIAADESGSGHAALAQDRLAQVYQDRQQYGKAADAWRIAIAKFGAENNARQQSLDQIIKPWGTFEPTPPQPAGQGATLDFRFRNAKQVAFEAHRIRIDTLIDDIKAYLRRDQQDIDWVQMQVDSVGYRLVERNERKYLAERVAEWTVDLEPREGHFDRRTTIAAPLQKAGAYLVVGKLPDGNVSRIVVWVDDTAIIRKPIAERSLYFIADAVSGRPLPGVNVEFFGWKHEYTDRQRRYRMLTKNFAEASDAEGLIVPDAKLLDPEYQWIAIARSQGRLAHLGFSHLWHSPRVDAALNETRVAVITDRPVYRPAQSMHFKFWVRPVSYSLTPEQSKAYAGQTFDIRLTDPMGTEVWTRQFTADEYGGFNGEHELPANATLGSYSLNIVNHPSIGGGGTFRVEEYKKPEYLVEIETPDKPARLGDTVRATIRAKYLFGAPVTNATVKYRVERTPHTERWFPPGPWDWLYGPGYWWFSSDDAWYPGFARWGCFGPRPSWIPWNPDPPELVLDVEAPIGEDGTVSVDIDTSLAKALHGDQDHSYKITAEVVDASRRTIVGQGNVLVARQPFKVFVWLNRGYYNVGDAIRVSAQARTLDGRPVSGTGKLTLYRVTYRADGEPEETVAGEWDVNPGEDGQVSQDINASEAGQYRAAYALTHAEEGAEPVTREGASLFVIRGQGFDGSDFRFTDLELIPDKAEYQPGETVQLMVNANRLNPSVLLFLRPVNGIAAGKPQVLRIDGRSATVPIAVAQSDMPNFFVDAVTVANGKVYSVTRELVVPPVKRILNVELHPSSPKYKPGEKAEVEVRLTDETGEPFTGSLALSIYDRAVEYISGGSNVPDLRAFFWKWRRSHHQHLEHSLSRWTDNLLRSGEVGMAYLGAFGAQVADFDRDNLAVLGAMDGGPVSTRQRFRRGSAVSELKSMDAPAAPGGFGGGMGRMEMAEMDLAAGQPADAGGGAAMVEPTVRSQFADTAFWKGDLTTDAEGRAKIDLTMPENLTGWKVRAWAMGDGTRVGEAVEEVVTFKNLLVRLQAPRFFVEKDEVMISAIVHNYLPHEKDAVAELVLDGDTLEKVCRTSNPHPVVIPAGGEARIDWIVKAIREGEAKITVKALTNEESDAMQMTFPVRVHGMLKTESFVGVIRPEDTSGTMTIRVPAERRPEQSQLEIRYSPTLAGAMVDALPYLVDYPYGCTEQTLNRFLPTVITHNILKRMNLDLAAIRDKRTNLNPQELGDPAARAADWARLTKNWHRELKNPVFDEAEVERMVKQGVADLTAMQVSDGGWGWFSGWGERSWPHTTCVVVHGLQIAERNGVALVPEVLPRGVAWLQRHQTEQVRLLQIGEKVENKEIVPEPGLQYRTRADNLDAFIYMVLADADIADDEMRRFLFRDRTHLSLYGAGLFGLALDKQQHIEQRDMIIRNIDQFVVTDEENQTTYIDLPNRDAYWWHWYGDTIEANACYLKLLTRVNPRDPRAAGLVKYLLNNRRHATYWNSTRDTAVCIEALAEYLVASGEMSPNMLVEVWIDGERKQSVEITPEALFSFNNTFVVAGADLTDGEHVIELRKQPLEQPVAGGRVPPAQPTPLYFNAYLTNFTLEDPIAAAGLEIKVGRKFYRLVQREDATDQVRGAHGQAIGQKALKYDRHELASLDSVASGDLIEVELEIDSKNDYEYVIFEDLKAAGCEPVELQSGYTQDGLGAYVEFRDERVSFFLRQLARGKRSVSYRLRAETPGKFSALPARASAMYAPELKANSDEMKLQVADRPEREAPAEDAAAAN